MFNLGYDDEDEEDEDNGDGEEEGFFDGDEDREMGNKSKRNVLLKDEKFHGWKNTMRMIAG